MDIVKLALIICLVFEIPSAKVIRISEEKSKSFSVKRVLVDVDSTSFLTKLNSLISDGLDAIIVKLENDGIFYKNYKMPAQNASLWNNFIWNKSRVLILIKCKLKNCLTECSALGG